MSVATANPSPLSGPSGFGLSFGRAIGPPGSPGMYLGFLGFMEFYEGGGNPTVSVPDPFREDWWPEVEPPQTAPLLLPDDRARIRDVNSEFDFNVAVALDKAVNGTSLMIILARRRPVVALSR
jgi:hypothetical protein